MTWLRIKCVKCGMIKDITLAEYPVAQNPKQRSMECPECGEIGIACLEMERPDQLPYIGQYRFLS